jgi:NAD(P)-dependent dehydrogenase (short-subunit alcohol dehydrogenase family)
MAVKTWFITGTSRGFGREWAIGALDRGDQVAATARDVSGLDDLVAKYVAKYREAIVPIRLDVTDRGACLAAVRQASKWALEGLSQSLAQKVAGFGIKVTLIEPGGYATDWAGPSARHAAPLPAYDRVREQAAQARPPDPGAG